MYRFNAKVFVLLFSATFIYITIIFPLHVIKHLALEEAEHNNHQYLHTFGPQLTC